MRASDIVCRLLENYDIDDPLERNDPAFYPAGFKAERENGDARVFELNLRESTPQVAVYSMSVYWTDEHIGDRRVLDSRSRHRIKPETAQEWLEKEAARWQQHGWKITWL